MNNNTKQLGSSKVTDAVKVLDKNAGLAIRTAIRAGAGNRRPENPTGGNSTNHNQTATR